jgi:hypothetical protein
LSHSGGVLMHGDGSSSKLTKVGKIDVASGKEEDLRGGAKPNSMSFFSGKPMPRNDSMLLADYY